MDRSWDCEFKLVDLLNGSSKAMNVDGSTTPVSFKYTIATGETWFLKCINIFLLHNGTMTHNVFGSLGSSLTNGVALKIHKGNVDTTVRNIQDNVDIFKTFPRNVVVGSSTNGFLDSNDYFFGCRVFDNFIRLCDGDHVEIVVQDDLSSVDRLEANINMWRPL